MSSTSKKLHVKCRNAPYSRDKTVNRFPVPDDKVSWDVSFPDYAPIEYTHQKVLDKPSYADPDIPKGSKDNHGLQFNTVDNKIDRKSFLGKYSIVDGRPQNPMGRTGISGRGALGRWGPNHAADPIVTRWKRDDKGGIEKNSDSKKPILQFVAIKRGDTNEWAIPGGMVDPGEDVSATLKREFSEEAMCSISADEASKKTIKDKVDQNFKDYKEVYKGYVDDPRNTDNAWMETVARNFHDESGEGIGKFSLTAGDDAVGVNWTDMSSHLALYASHRDFIEIVAQNLKAHW